MIVLIIAAISISIALGFLTLYTNNWYSSKQEQIDYNENVDSQMEAFCKIDLDGMLVRQSNVGAKDVSELKRKIQHFKDRNRFYSM